jgi:hypothetical protein
MITRSTFARHRETGCLEVDHTGHYAEAFAVMPGQCFRMVQGKAGQQGAPTHCPDPVEYRGKFVAQGSEKIEWSPTRRQMMCASPCRRSGPY